MAELTLDATILAGLLLLKAAVLWFFVRLADRTRGELSKKRSICYTILLGALYLFFNTDGHYLGVLLVVSFTVLVAALLLIHSCNLTWIRAFPVSILFVIFSVLISGHSGHWLDQMLPGRRTVESMLIETLDAFSYGEQVEKEEFLASETLGAALHVAVKRTIVGNVVGMFAGQVQAEMDTYARAEMISSNASKHAAFIDELSTVGAAQGTELSDDSYDIVQPDEMTKQLKARDSPKEKNQAPVTADSGSTIGPSGGSGRETEKKDVPEILASKTAPVTAQSTPQATYAVVPGLGIGDAILADVILTHLCSAGNDKSRFLALKEPSNADPNLKLSIDTIEQTLRNMTSEEREKWMNARRAINVEATLKMRTRSVAVVNGELVEPGDVVSIPGEGTNYTFRLMSVGPFEIYWAPLLGNGKSNQSRILRMSW